MFYETGDRDKAILPHDPFKAIVAPRPIASHPSLVPALMFTRSAGIPSRPARFWRIRGLKSLSRGRSARIVTSRLATP